MGAKQETVTAEEITLEATATHHTEDVHHLSEKVHDGDVALEMLHTHYEPFTPEEERRVLWKIDLRMCVLMLVVNGLQFIDKQAIGAAATYGLQKQAGLQGSEFSLLVSIFSIGYLVAQYPTNWLMQRFPTGKYITVNFVLWGATLAATGAARSFAGLAAGRFMLGVFESCLNPGFVLITSSWWKREEQTSRVALWYCANGLFGAPSGGIFYGIAHINYNGMFTYQWIFIILGCVTMLFGCVLWFLLSDSVVTAGFLTERERIIAIERLRTNKTGVKNSTHKKYQVKEALTDIKVWLLIAAVFLHNMTTPLQTTFSGLVIVGLGYTSNQAILLNICPGIIMATSMLLAGFLLATRIGQGKRIFVIIGFYIPGILSCLLLFLSPIGDSTRSQNLFAIMIIASVATSAGLMYSLLASNIAGYTKKTFAGALFFTSNSLAQIISPQTFLASEAPKYKTGVAVCLVSFALVILVFISLYFIYRRENNKRDRECEGMEAEEDSADELVNAFSDMTDGENKRFRYKM